MANLTNIGVPQVTNRAFVALAIEAGIETTIQSLVGLAMDEVSLLSALKDVLQESNAPLAAALNLQTLQAILAYISAKQSSPIVSAAELPSLLDEAGPASVSAARDGGDATQINVTFSEPPSGYRYELYLDGVFVKADDLTPAAGFVNEALFEVAEGSHTVRVLYQRESDGAITRFGPLANVE